MDKISHQPENHAAQVAPGERRHQEHDDRGKKRRADDAAEQERRAVELSLAPAQKINSRNRRDGSEKCAQRRDQRKPRRDDQREDRAKRRAAGNAQNIRIGQRVAQQRLETRARNRKRRAHQNARAKCAAGANQKQSGGTRSAIRWPGRSQSGRDPDTRSVTEMGTAPSFRASTTHASSNTARPPQVHSNRLNGQRAHAQASSIFGASGAGFSLWGLVLASPNPTG